MKKIMNYLKVSANKVGVAFLQIFLCTTSYAQQFNVDYKRDISVSASTEEFEAKQTFKKVIGMLNLKDSKASVSLYSSVIGEPGIVKVNVAKLPSSSSVSERNRDLSRFIKKGLSDFQSLAQPATHQRTEIFRNLAMTDQYEPGADRTLLIIESDFVESGYVAEFFHYANKPSGLIDDFDEIIAAFKKDSQLPNLAGVEVIMVVTQSDSELVLWSARFWERAFMLFGAKEVTIKAAL